MNSEPVGRERRLCDLVMKGGITSGVVYPLAVCELADTYNFKNIGGTSAGAIAAAATAAAELGRRLGSQDAKAFQGLAGLPAWIGTPGRLVEMFRPDLSTKPLFGLLMAALNPRSRLAKAVSVAGQSLMQFRGSALALVLVVAAIWFWVLRDLKGFTLLYAATTTIILASLAFVVVVVAFLWGQITRTLPANFYGITRGYDPRIQIADAEGPLTNWLTKYLNELAGKRLTNGPLTFGDLYRAPRAPVDPQPDGPEYRAINLEMMTTALNHGRPYRLPFRAPDRLFYFSEEDFATLFPPMVVRHMITHSRQDEGPVPQAKGSKQLYGFPEPDDLPVVVATRMSLSFPLLLAAVPLYAVDYTLAENQDKSKAARAERCWFSDGGICSNLPIHFFDAPLPLWPTFAINLKQFHPDYPDESGAVWLPSNARSGWQPVWARFEQPGAFGRVSAFLWAIVNTMQNWQDNAQARVPGYRDRLVHVSQRDEEGGLNLNMPSDVIARLSDRGKRAGAALTAKFGPAGGGWSEHRWVRFRSCMELTNDWIQRVAEAYFRRITPDPPLETLLLRKPTEAPDAYRLQSADQLRGKKAMDALGDMWATWNRDGTGFQDDPPRPTPELRVRPKI